MATTIKLKNGSGAPLAADLVQGEPAFDLTNKRLYTEDSLGAVIEIGTNPSSLTTSSADINGGTIDGVTIGGASAGAITGTTITGTSFVSSGDMTFGDNDKAIFGAGSDLQIYHDGTNSYISDSGQGRLIILSDGAGTRINTSTGEIMAEFVKDAEVSLRYNNSVKLATTATGIDVTGTVTADGLTVDGTFEIFGTSDAFGSTASSAYILKTGSLGTAPFTQTGALVYQPRTSTVDGRSNHLFYTGDPLALRLNIQPNGDISFYEDTGTTPKLFWDASAESLGIGTTSPGQKLHVYGNSGNTIIGVGDNSLTAPFVYIEADADNSIGRLTARSNHPLAFKTNNIERMRLDSSGNLGLGVTPSGWSGYGVPVLEMPSNGTIVSAGTNNYLGANWYYSGSSFLYKTTAAASYFSQSGGAFRWYTAPSGTAGNTITFTQAMTLDASGNLGVGRTNPGERLSVQDTSKTSTTVGANVIAGFRSFGTGADTCITLTDGATYAAQFGQNSGSLYWMTNSTERMRIDSSGNVGVGTTSPAYLLTVQPSSGNAQLGIRTNDTTSLAQLIFGRSDDSNRGGIYYDMTEEAMEFHAGNTGEKMRIDSTGNLLVGTTSTSIATTSTETGTQIYDGGISIAANNPVAQFNRITSDGSIVNFRKDGTVVGSIGVDYGDRLYIGSGDTGLFFNPDVDTVQPHNPSGSVVRDALINLGTSTSRFKDLYLSGGVYVGGTGAANLLDDYEEGTFTPALFGTSTTGSGTYTLQAGNYTKIGDVVYFNIRLTVTAHTGTGSMKISGLPFVTSSDSGKRVGAIPASAQNITLASSTNKFFASTSASSQNLNLVEADFTGGWADVALDSNCSIFVSGVYSV